MAADLPAGALASRRLGTALTLAPVTLLAGMLLLATAGPLPVLVLGRSSPASATPWSWSAASPRCSRTSRGPRASMRLNTLEFAGMLGVLGGLAVVGLLPERWAWNVTLLAAATPVLVAARGHARAGRYFPARLGAAPPAPARGRAPRPARGRWRCRRSCALMFALGVIMALAWSAVSQFVIPLRGTREFGLDRAGISGLLSLAQLVDLLGAAAGGLARRPRGPASGADRRWRRSSGSALFAVGLGSLPLLGLGCALFGLGMAGWMLPLGVIRDHTDGARLGWRTGVYRVGVDGAIFLGPVVCGLLGEGRAPIFIGLIGVAAFAIAGRLWWTAAVGAAHPSPRPLPGGERGREWGQPLKLIFLWAPSQ